MEAEAWLAHDAAHGCQKKIGLERFDEPALGPGALGPGDEFRRSLRGQLEARRKSPASALCGTLIANFTP